MHLAVSVHFVGPEFRNHPGSGPPGRVWQVPVSTAGKLSSCSGWQSKLTRRMKSNSVACDISETSVAESFDEGSHL